MPTGNALLAVAYISTAVVPIQETLLEALLVDARAFNAKVGVTGVLLLHDQTFFQYFEGPADGVEQVLARVQASTLHTGMFEMLHDEIEERAFSTWMMGFADAPNSLLLQLQQAQWHQEAKARKGAPFASDGLQLLLQFWQRARGGMAF